ncbi:Uncharacterised protein [Vibrio cholerae]|nr:Uncharacterised protein [Vibrio cholerae]
MATLEAIFSWGFMLRHCCVCVYGDNLAECFGHYEPSWEIATACQLFADYVPRQAVV